MSVERFRWHPQAAVHDAAGRRTAPLAEGPAVIAPQPSGKALAQALAAAGAFRIGAQSAPPPATGRQPMFETLTSGSTGTPRRIWRSQASWLASFAVNAALFGIGPGVRVAVLGGLVQSLALYGALEAVHLGAALHLLDGHRPGAQMAALARHRIGVLYASPAQLRLLAEAGGRLPGLRLVLVGGAKLDAGLRAAMAERAPGAELREFYGAAEASFITLADAQSPPDSVGLPYPGVEIRLREGALWVRSPYLFTRYGGADQSGARWDEGWLSVGEMGRLEGGQLYLLGRAGRMVTVSDQNVFPEGIEAFIAGLPGVRQVAVIARPDPRRGHVMEAVLQGDPAAEAAILAAARARFGPIAAPRRIWWRADWPLLASGKADLSAITREAGA